MCYSKVLKIKANISFPVFFFLRAKWKSQNGQYNYYVLRTTKYLHNTEF